MGLRIATNIASETVQRNIKDVSDESNGLLNKLSSGSRITKAADDAAGLSISANLKAQTQGLRQATRNANDGIAFLQTAEGGLNEISNILIRLRELSIQAASDTIGPEERELIGSEYGQLLMEIDRIALSTTFNGTALLNGEGKGKLRFQVGAFTGDENHINFDSGDYDARIDSLGLKRTAINDQDAALDSLDSLDEAIDLVNKQRASFGAIQIRLQSTIRNLETQTLNQEEARSKIEDLDVAKATAELASNNVIKSAGIASLAQANAIPNSALRLIV